MSQTSLTICFVALLKRIVITFKVINLPFTIFRRIPLRSYLSTFENLKNISRSTSRKRQSQLNVSKRFSKYEISDVWFDITNYIADSNDGVRSYHQKYQWLECFLFSDIVDSKQVSPTEFQIARVEFESTPGNFIEHFEAFSKLLTIRDLCDSIMVHLSRNHDWWALYGQPFGEGEVSELRFWIHLHASLLRLMDDTDHLRIHALEDDSRSLITALQIINDDLDFNKDHSYSSANENLQRFLQRSDKHQKQRYKSKCCFPTEYPDMY